ncbi:rhomboid family protein [Natrialba magadii ATCC 43099]|uniref:Rhomboid family protein n=1 Tax=Natrialba magadii (strain ATCC 43099 / DSM 3394 / CCM 3739 / CIP 104546 / IAM 13178 / JCM 8861 / NBRC 102185 / NCIMB 2190 / MS3) TaxID=547559 RepID=D3SYA7_NATMM|nr:rhomboid family intramembrane serine protease [Natrialba magadii]ADD06078.1 rhomboid family protein [Natrialba magadii ATCC 43099]ELY30925.1 rhomboid family protein [Natrialba magadii ATCC 43099]
MANRSRPRPGASASRSTGSGSSASESPAANDQPSPIYELLVIFGLVFLIQVITDIVGIMAGLFVLTLPLAENPWTIVTSVYAHGGLWHLLSNSLALVLFGWPVARATSRVRFHTFVLVTGSIAGISQVLISGFAAAAPIVSGDPVGVLGASGAIFALLGYLITGNRLSAGFASIIDVPQWVTIAVFVGLATVVTLMTAAPRVALIAHFTGFLLGLLAGRARLLEI